MNIENERQQFLLEELHEYEKHTEMSNDERKALHKWVMDGNIVHENSSLAEDGHGNYIDFIDVYRYEQEISERLSEMDEEDRTEYIAALQGEDTLKSLRGKYEELLYRAEVYERVLMRHHLIDEASRLMDEGRRISEEFAKSVSADGLPMLEGGPYGKNT